MPDRELIAAMGRQAGRVALWEIAPHPEQAAAALAAAAEAPVPVALGASRPRGGRRFSHFPRMGLDPGGPFPGNCRAR